MKKIPLTGVKGHGKFVLVDDEDYEFLNQIKWHESRKGYAEGYLPVRLKKLLGYKPKNIQMQRLLLLKKIANGLLVDHINRDKLDNRKENLRLCTIEQSNSNRGKITFKKQAEIISKYKGVHWSRNRWRATITVNNKKEYLGFFDTEEEAALAYNQAASLYLGEYACLNEVG